MESFKNRLKRFTATGPCEIPSTLLNSIANFFLPQLRIAKEHKLDQLIFLGTHAVIQTISEKIFGKRGRDGTSFYLKNFVDGNTYDTKFSMISDQIHAMRNIIAHQWMSSHTHGIAMDYLMPEGWKLKNDLLHINPDIYLEQFLKGFGRGGPIWKYDQLITETESLLRKYEFIKNWLELDGKHPISIAISDLESCCTPQQIRSQERRIRNLIFKEYELI